MREKRELYGITQSRLAAAIGVTRIYLSYLETGKKQIASQERKEYIMEVLERFNPESPLILIFDYMRIRFRTTNVKYVIEEILRLRFEHMVKENYSFFRYTEMYHYGNIMILTSSDEAKGTLLELHGKGCREFENVLDAQNRTWWDFLTECYYQDAVMKRVDLAVNDVHGILDVGELIRKSKTEECVSLFRKFTAYASGELTKEDDKLGMGQTLYLGSMRESKVYFCIYEKDYEQYIKNGIPIDEAPIKNRFEIRLMDERAEEALKDLLVHQDYEKTVFGIINQYVKFVDIDLTQKRKDRQKPNERWEHFTGKNREKLKLTVQPEPYTYDKSLNWLGKQVAPTIVLVQKIDKANGTHELQRIIQNAVLSEKHEKIFQQQTMSVQDMIKKG